MDYNFFFSFPIAIPPLPRPSIPPLTIILPSTSPPAQFTTLPVSPVWSAFPLVSLCLKNGHLQTHVLSFSSPHFLRKLPVCSALRSWDNFYLCSLTFFSQGSTNSPSSTENQQVKSTMTPNKAPEIDGGKKCVQHLLGALAKVTRGSSQL